MIDCEVKIFNNVHAVASQLCPRFISAPIQDYTKLPTAALYEIDNTMNRQKKTSSMAEDFARLTYMMDVVATTKSECRKIFSEIDEQMTRLNFSRLGGQYVTYPDNMKIARYVARYEAEVDTEGNLYRIG